MNRFNFFLFVVIILLILLMMPLEVHSKDKLAMVPNHSKAKLTYSMKCLFNVRENVKELLIIEDSHNVDEETCASYFQLMNETVSNLIEASIYAPNVRPDLIRTAKKICDYEFSLLVTRPDLKPSTIRSVSVNMAYLSDLLKDFNKRELLYSLAKNPKLLKTREINASGEFDFFIRNHILIREVIDGSRLKKNSKRLVSLEKFIAFEDTVEAGERYYRELELLKNLSVKEF